MLFHFIVWIIHSHWDLMKIKYIQSIYKSTGYTVIISQMSTIIITALLKLCTNISMTVILVKPKQSKCISKLIRAHTLK